MPLRAIRNIVADDRDNLYVDSSLGRGAVFRITPGGEISTLISRSGPAANDIPMRLAARGRHIYIVLASRSILIWDSHADTYIVRHAPHNIFGTDIAVDNNGNIYSAYWHCIYRYSTATDVVDRYAGDEARPGYLNGPRANALFDNPTELTLDDMGNIYVVEVGLIRRIAPDGMVSLFSGTPGVDDRIFSPTTIFGLSIDHVGPDRTALYAVDNHSVLRIESIPGHGVNRRIIAGAPQAGFQNGPANLSRFNEPRGLCRNSLGHLYVSDMLNEAIRRIEMNAGEPIAVTTLVNEPPPPALAPRIVYPPIGLLPPLPFPAAPPPHAPAAPPPHAPAAPPHPGPAAPPRPIYPPLQRTLEDLILGPRTITPPTLLSTFPLIRCVICQEDKEVTDLVTMRCGDRFCLNCILGWVNSRDTYGVSHNHCPLCRRIIVRGAH